MVRLPDATVWVWLGCLMPLFGYPTPFEFRSRPRLPSTVRVMVMVSAGELRWGNKGGEGLWSESGLVLDIYAGMRFYVSSGVGLHVWTGEYIHLGVGVEVWAGEYLHLGVGVEVWAGEYLHLVVGVEVWAVEYLHLEVGLAVLTGEYLHLGATLSLFLGVLRYLDHLPCRDQA